MLRFAFLLSAISLLVPLSVVAQENQPIPGIGPVGEVQQLRTSFQFTEGPASDGEGNLYFSDIPANRIYKIDSDGEMSVLLQPSGHANGLMFHGPQTLLVCQMDGQVVAVDVQTKEVRTIAATYEGTRFNAPNDLVVDRHGGIYFTDPRYRAPDPWPQGKEAFYYVSADGEVTRLGDDLLAPNGVILSPDEQTLYIIPTLQKEMMAYPIKGPGQIGEGRVFCTLQQPEGVDDSGGDGLAVDTRGNLYITSRLGIQVFDPEGQLLGIIRFPEQPANVTFGGPHNRTLYVTARSSLYAVEMEATGHQFGGHTGTDH